MKCQVKPEAIYRRGPMQQVANAMMRCVRSRVVLLTLGFIGNIKHNIKHAEQTDY